MPRAKKKNVVHRRKTGSDRRQPTARVNSCHLHGSFAIGSDRRPRGSQDSTKPRISVKPSVCPGAGHDARAIHGYERPLERGAPTAAAAAAAARSGDRSTRHHMVCRDLRAHKHAGASTLHETPEKASRNCGIPTESAGAPSSTHASRIAPSVTRRKFVTWPPKVFPKNQEQCMRMRRVLGTTGCPFSRRY